jgi:hypothetical protein
MGTIHQALYSSSYTRFMGVKNKNKKSYSKSSTIRFTHPRKSSIVTTQSASSSQTTRGPSGLNASDGISFSRAGDNCPRFIDERKSGANGACAAGSGDELASHALGKGLLDASELTSCFKCAKEKDQNHGQSAEIRHFSYFDTENRQSELQTWRSAVGLLCRPRPCR